MITSSLSLAFRYRDLWSRRILVMSTNNAVINCIPSPLPHSPGNSRDLAGTYLGIYRMLCSRRPGPTPGLCGEIFPSKGLEIYYHGMSAYAENSDQRRPELWSGDLPWDLQEKCSPPPAVPRAIPWTSQSTKLISRQVPAIPKLQGAGFTIDSCIIGVSSLK